MTEKEELKPYSINEAHHKWGHHGEERLRKMAETKGLRLTGKLEECDSCGIVKAKAKPIPKQTDESKKASNVGERQFINITGPFPLTGTKWHRAIRNKLYWYGMSDQKSGKMISSFQFNKDNRVDFVVETFT